MRRIDIKKPIIAAILIFGLFNFVQAADSRSYPVTATYCGGSKLDIYPYSFVTRDDGSVFNCYEVAASPIQDGYRYGFEDKDDYDYNDVIIELWVTGNNTGSPTAHVKYVSKEAAYRHWVYVVYNGIQQLVFKAEEASPGAVFDIPLPVKQCGDFEVKASPPQRAIEAGDSTHYTVTIKALDGFTADVNLSVSGLPTGAAGTFDPNPLPITGESKLEITTTPEVPVGIYTLIITGTAGELSHTAEVILEIKEKPPEPDFTIEADPAEQTVYPGESAGYNIKVTAVNGFSQPVELYVEPLPDGVTADFNPRIFKPTKESLLTLTTSNSTSLGAYKLTVAARGGGIKRILKITLTVKERPPEPDFDIKAVPGDRTLFRGESTNYTITVTAINGFSADVSLNVTGVPANTAAAFTTVTLTPTGTSQLQITTSLDTPIGDVTLTITGKSGDKERSAVVKLSVVCRDFTLAIKAEPAKGPAPLTAAFTANVTNNDGYSAGDYLYLWNFGDGNTSNLQNPGHTFQAPGNYQVKLTVTDPCSQSKTAAQAIEVEGFAGAVNKSFSVPEAMPGDEVFFTIEARNDTRFDFTTIIIKDEFSPLLAYIEDDAAVTPRRSGQEILWQFPVLAKGESLRFLVKVKVSESAPQGTITNVAYLLHDSLGPGKGITSNTASLTVNKIDITLLKQVEQTGAKPGDTLKYQLIVKNNSAVPLTGIKLTDELSNHLEFVSQDGNLEFTRQGQHLQWAGSIDAQQQAVIVIKARVSSETFSGTRVENKARLEAAELKAPMDSNTVETHISAEPVPSTKVRFTKQSEVPQTEVGRIIRFNITAANMSDSSLISPVIEDYLPQGFSYVESSTLINNQRFSEPQGQRHLLWQLPHLEPGETLVLRFQVVIGTDAKRGRNINRATLRAVDNSGQGIFLEASAFVNVSDAGFIFYCGVEGTVFLDRDDDNFYSMADTPLEGIDVRLSTGEKAITDAMGHYLFESLFPGEYAVGVNTVTLPEKYRLADPYPKVVVLADGLTDTADFAVKFKGEDDVRNARLQGRVFFDKNQNQVYDSEDTLCEKFKALLGDQLLTDGSGGIFVFSNIEPGTYTVEILYDNKTVKKEVKIEKGNNQVDIPLRFSAITVIITGEK